MLYPVSLVQGIPIATRVALAAVVASTCVLATVSVQALSDGPHQQGSSPATTSELSAVTANDTPGVVKTYDGFTVEYQQARDIGQGRIVLYYKSSTDGATAFAEMLGIPRIENPDGTHVLPIAYGNLTHREDIEVTPGLPAGSLGAIYPRDGIQAGAVVRFGPFFRAAETGAAFSGSGAEFLAGKEFVIQGERIRVTAKQMDAGVQVEMVNIEESGNIVVSHPRSRESIVVNGEAREIVHGSTNFAKTLGYDVNANRSSITFTGTLEPGDVIEISRSSTGRVHRGQWDFPVEIE